MLVTTPQPAAENLPDYYESDAYISHTDSEKGLLPFLYQKVKQRALKKKVHLITQLNKGTGSVLDIGAGTGEFLKVASEKGWEIYGAEPNEKARLISEKKGIDLIEIFNDYSNQKFDVITLWHVLEHLPNLHESIKEIENLLKPGGTLLIAVPNYKSFDAKFYKDFWAAYDVPRHLWHFSKESMVELFSETTTVQKIKPMIFDSFYVSLLSEKYKTGNSFSLRAVWIGFWSNVRAWSSKEYSSHIYCFKKSSKVN
ncbi:class I SAM-dependent methyltransferase [Marixanthomonas ophiurae]|uniref:Class I SAM-dependent methyltransferase n=2 Tax=Marixanthomonas ophiurae TaxID=387659 RepID=A0A3E1QE66_9FLAO|nr:class I SAM-dependent methyltransferase [Marixanthomonas ophiurae]